MNQIKGNGIPTRKTKGALGDIYTDTNTGKKYKCVFSYRDSDDDNFDCQWKELSEDTKSGVKPEVENTKSGVKPEVENTKPVVEPEAKKPVIEEKPKQHNGKTNYAAYSKK